MTELTGTTVLALAMVIVVEIAFWIFLERRAA